MVKFLKKKMFSPHDTCNWEKNLLTYVIASIDISHVNTEIFNIHTD